MSQLSKAQLDTKYADAAGQFATNGTGAITGATLQEYADDNNDSFFTIADNPNLAAVSSNLFRAAVTVSSAELLAIGGTPKTIVAAPGANKFLAVKSISASYKYNSTPYDFGSSESPTFIIGSGNGVGQIGYTTMNESNDFNVILQVPYLAASQKITTNTALTLTTGDGNEASVGNGDLDVVVWYTIENINT